MFVPHPSPSPNVTAIDSISSSVCGASKERSQCNTKKTQQTNKQKLGWINQMGMLIFCVSQQITSAIFSYQ